MPKAKPNAVIGRPRRQRARNSAEIEGFVTADDVEIIDSEADTIAKVQAALSESEGQSDWLIRVSQVVKSPEGTRVGWVFNAEIGELEVIRERIKQECGPGRYRLRVMRDSVPFKQYDLEIIPTLADRRAAMAPAATTMVQPQPAGTSPEMLAILSGLQRGQEQLTAALAAIANRPAGPSMTDLLTQMKLMREMMPEPAAPNVGFEMFMKALTVAKDLVGEGGGGAGATSSPLLAFAEKIVPTLLDKWPAIAQQVAAQQPQPALVPQMMPPHQPAPLMPQPAPAEVATQQQRVDQADRLKKYLLENAAKGTDPSMCADFLMENMPPELNEGLLAADDPLALVLQLIPEAAPHKAWFGRLLDLIFEPLDPIDVPKGAVNGNATANRPN